MYHGIFKEKFLNLADVMRLCKDDGSQHEYLQIVKIKCVTYLFINCEQLKTAFPVRE